MKGVWGGRSTQTRRTHVRNKHTKVAAGVEGSEGTEQPAHQVSQTSGPTLSLSGREDSLVRVIVAVLEGMRVEGS